MVKYGRSLIQELPKETTELLVTLCTDWPVGRETRDHTHLSSGTIQGPSGEKTLVPYSQKY